MRTRIAVFIILPMRGIGGMHGGTSSSFLDTGILLAWYECQIEVEPQLLIPLFQTRTLEHSMKQSYHKLEN